MLDLSKAAQQDHWPSLVRFRGGKQGDSIRLCFDLRELRQSYLTELDSLPVYHLQPTQFVAKKATLYPRRTSNEEDTVPTPTLSPNPANTATVLSFGTLGQHTVQVYSADGRHLRSYSTLAAQLRIDVNDLPAGMYLLRVSTSTSFTSPVTLRLAVHR